MNAYDFIHRKSDKEKEADKMVKEGKRNTDAYLKSLGTSRKALEAERERRNKQYEEDQKKGKELTDKYFSGKKSEDKPKSKEQSTWEYLWSELMDGRTWTEEGRDRKRVENMLWDMSYEDREEVIEAVKDMDDKEREAWLKNYTRNYSSKKNK